MKDHEIKKLVDDTVVDVVDYLHNRIINLEDRVAGIENILGITEARALRSQLNRLVAVAKEARERLDAVASEKV